MQTYEKGAADAVEWARSQLDKGPWEKPAGSNNNEYGRIYGLNYEPWCVIFAWCAAHLTGQDGAVFKTAATDAARDWAKSIGRWYTTPAPGDWSIMVNASGATIHTDLVESYEGGRLVCIGGNTSDGSGSTADGGGVYRNDRTSKWKDGRIIGFYRPFYGLSGDDVKAIQAAARITPDGVYGPGTRAAVKTWQANHGLSATGEPTPETYTAMTGRPVEGDDDMFNDADRGALKELFETQKRHSQILELLDDNVNDPKSKLQQGLDRILGFLVQRRYPDGKPARALDTMDGDTLRNDIRSMKG